jgi:hypothetical protein
MSKLTFSYSKNNDKTIYNALELSRVPRSKILRKMVRIGASFAFWSGDPSEKSAMNSMLYPNLAKMMSDLPDDIIVERILMLCEFSLNAPAVTTKIKPVENTNSSNDDFVADVVHSGKSVTEYDLEGCELF